MAEAQGRGFSTGPNIALRPSRSRSRRRRSGFTATSARRCFGTPRWMARCRSWTTIWSSGSPRPLPNASVGGQGSLGHQASSRLGEGGIGLSEAGVHGRGARRAGAGRCRRNPLAQGRGRLLADRSHALSSFGRRRSHADGAGREPLDRREGDRRGGDRRGDRPGVGCPRAAIASCRWPPIRRLPPAMPVLQAATPAAKRRNRSLC